MDIQKIIKEKGYTIKKVADRMPNPRNDKTGISQGSLSTIINGNPSVNKLEEIANIIGCKVSDFFADEQKDAGNFIKCPHCGERIYFGGEEKTLNSMGLEKMEE